MKMKISVQSKDLVEQLTHTYYKQESKVTGYNLGLMLELEGSVKREYILFQVDKDTFAKYKQGDNFELQDLAQPEVAPETHSGT